MEGDLSTGTYGPLHAREDTSNPRSLTPIPTTIPTYLQTTDKPTYLQSPATHLRSYLRQNPPPRTYLPQPTYACTTDLRPTTLRPPQSNRDLTHLTYDKLMIVTPTVQQTNPPSRIQLYAITYVQLYLQFYLQSTYNPTFITTHLRPARDPAGRPYLLHSTPCA